MGEHDTETTIDGKHKDVRVARYESHEGFSRETMINDLMMIWLKKDVSFDGELKKLYKIQFDSLRL